MIYDSLATTTDFDLIAEHLIFNFWIFLTLLVLTLSIYFSKKVIDNF